MEPLHAPLDEAAAYRVVTARDARFDGRLFVGVTSTGVYCRPICRVRTPMRKNCRYFGTPAQAEAASFRPCMKCRPEIAPGAGLRWTVMDASRTLAHQACEELDGQALEGKSPGLLRVAERLGISDRHLRRIFLAEHGVTPLQYFQTRRLLLAKQLLTDTTLPMAQIALASGFQSVRRFNASFLRSYRMSPSRLRREADVSSHDSSAALCLRLAYREPYDLPALLRFLALRAISSVEAVDGRRVRRSLRAGTVAAEPGWVEVDFSLRGPTVELRVSPALAGSLGRVVAAVRRWLDLDSMPHAVDAALRDLPGPPGVRLPGSLDAFELSTRAILGQQITVAAARTLAQRLVERFGHPIPTPWTDISRVFPAPAELAIVAPERIAELGIIRKRAEAIVAMARAWPEIAVLLDPRARAEPLLERLCSLPGVGPWTAHYIAMRALSWPDAFPPNDVAVLKAMRQHFNSATHGEASAQAQSWRPWRAYGVQRLWNSLATRSAE